VRPHKERPVQRRARRYVGRDEQSYQGVASRVEGRHSLSTASKEQALEGSYGIQEGISRLKSSGSPAVDAT